VSKACGHNDLAQQDGPKESDSGEFFVATPRTNYLRLKKELEYLGGFGYSRVHITQFFGGVLGR
jgi:hypothetical protein